jgi:hypothetical protein
VCVSCTASVSNLQRRRLSATSFPKCYQATRVAYWTAVIANNSCVQDTQHQRLDCRGSLLLLSSSSRYILFLATHGGGRLHAKQHLILDVLWHGLVVVEESLCWYHRLPSSVLGRLPLSRINLYRPDLAQHSVYQRTCCSRQYESDPGVSARCLRYPSKL